MGVCTIIGGCNLQNCFVHAHDCTYLTEILDLRGTPFSAVTFEISFFPCYYIVTRECHKSPESLCRELSKFTHYFDLVAMTTLLAF